MKASVVDVARFAFCPQFYAQHGTVPNSDAADQRDLASLVTYAFRRELESDSKTNWKSILDKWTRIYWDHHNKNDDDDKFKFNRSLIALKQFYTWYENVEADVLALNFSLSASLYNHQLLGEIPVILDNNDDTVSLILIEPIQKIGEAKWSPNVRYLSVAMDQTITVSKIIVLSLTNYCAFNTFTIEPNARFWETAMLDLLNILQSMQDGVLYSNTLACHFCPLALACEAVNG